MTQRQQPAVLAATIGAIGVVFGDIGTSTLYAMDAVLHEATSRGHAIDRDLVYGMTSTLLWTMTLVVTLLYVQVLLRTDNDGEGGLLSLFSLLRRTIGRGRSAIVLAVVAMFGAAMFLGDSVITPAISVLSATEGLEVADQGLKHVVLPLTLVVLVALFAIQRFGTGRIGKAFGPIMLVWFGVSALAGLHAIVQHPGVLQALSPVWAVRYFVDEPTLAFLSLGAIVLAVTGAEALYADLGHFGRRAIASGWLWIVFPALVLSYLGQGAGVIADHANATDPFFQLVPSWGRIPVVVLATLATIIASQAVISGAFTVIHQASRLGFLPHLSTVHTSRDQVGQIYLPAVNWILGVTVVGVVLGFRTSAALASAYGVAVTSTIVVTTTLYLFLTSARGRRRSAAFVVASIALVAVVVILAANVPKIASGGWLPLLIGVVLITVMTTWDAGRRLARAARREHEADVSTLLDAVRDGVEEDDGTRTPVVRLPASAVFVTRDEGVVPMALRTMLTRNKALHEHVVLLSWRSLDTPTARRSERLRVDTLGNPTDGIVQVSAAFGFLDHPDLTRVLAQAKQECEGELDELDPDDVVYYVSAVVVRAGRHGMARWRQHLFIGMERVAPDPVEVLRLPRDRTVVIGREITL